MAKPSPFFIAKTNVIKCKNVLVIHIMVEIILASLIVFRPLYVNGNANAKYLSAAANINVTKEILMDIDAITYIVKVEYAKTIKADENHKLLVVLQLTCTTVPAVKSLGR